jgi:hypothetical protein
MIKPISPAQLRACFDDYASAFPDWTRESDIALVRGVGPVRQRIGVEGLRSGAYRPWGTVEVLLAPLGRALGILPRHLDIKHREVRPQQHAAKWREVVDAIEEQFQPPVRQPLDLEDTLRRGSAEVVEARVENANYDCALAALAAHLGMDEEALRWCERAIARFETPGRTPFPWEAPLVQFARGLARASRSGKGRVFLEEGKPE